MIKKIIPSTLIGRSIIIIFVPIIIIVLLTSFVFYQTSWSIISKRLTESVAADINVLVKLINSDLTDNAINIASQDFKMKINIINDKGKNEKNSKLRTQNLIKPILENGSSLCTSLFL